MIKTVLNFENWDLNIVSNFDIRISNFQCKALCEFPLFVSVWFQDLFHRPHRAAFHLSLTVLVHYRSQKVFSLGP